MAGYSKNIAVVRGLKDGFSADGGPLSGLVKAEKYGRGLVVEVSLINFAPLSEGRFVTAITDGKTTLCVENNRFEGESELDTSRGFAALVCYINDKIYPVASAICGNYRGEALGIKKVLERLENAKADNNKGETAQTEEVEKIVYEDEAIAEENYYEYEADESKSALREDKAQKENGQELGQNEAAFSAFEKDKSGVNAAYSGGKPQQNNVSGSKLQQDGVSGGKSQQDGISGLAGGDFYEKMREEIENIFAQYPPENALEQLIEGSRWVRISYGENGFYVFGVLYADNKAEYVCYGVPARDSERPPESMKNLASFIPAPDGDFAGYWVMYQDARTGASLKIENL